MLPNYIVAYNEGDGLPRPPQYFVCDQADDAAHAKEQCENAYPGCVVLKTSKLVWE